MNESKIKEAIITILQEIGEKPDREGLKETPKRITDMYHEVFRGYDELAKPKITTFDNGADGIKYDQMIVDTGYFFSFCEHHMIPFFGTYYFAYIPDKKVLGLSKIARIVDYYSAKLQIQERLTKEIVDEIERVVQPRGIALVLKARHLCKEMRGIRKYNSGMITSEVRGILRDNFQTRQEFLNIIKQYD